jgi:hypothetical protein
MASHRTIAELQRRVLDATGQKGRILSADKSFAGPRKETPQLLLSE